MKKKIIENPVPSTFLLIGIIGLVVVATQGYFNRLPISWAFAFGLIFAIMIISSFASMNPNQA